MKHYLLDASSFMVLIKKAETQRVIDCLRDSVILDLTCYEVGNAIWKESVLTKILTPNDCERLSSLAQTILAKIDQIRIEVEAFRGILEVARNERLSFYDASYEYFAKDRGFVLVTEDNELKTKAKKHVDVQTITTLLSR